MHQSEIKLRIIEKISAILLLLAILLGCGSDHGSIRDSSNKVIQSPSLLLIEITPANSTIPLGLSLSFSATGLYSDTTTKDLTADVVWSSSDTNVAVTSKQADGVVAIRARAVGVAIITAKLGTISSTTNITVTEATLQSIEIWPTDIPMAVGALQRFYAYGNMSDNSSLDITDLVNWNASDPGIASVSRTQDGFTCVHSLSVGQSVITAAYAGKTTSTPVYVLPIQTLAVEQLGSHMPRIGIDGMGSITAIWQDWIAKPSVFSSARYEKEKGWLVESVLETHSQNQLPGGYDMVFNEKGQGLLVWAAYQSSYFSNYSPIDGWQTPQVISQDVFKTSLRDAIDSSGNGIATWSIQGKVYTSQYNAATSWSPPMEQGASGTSATIPIVSMNSVGDAVLVWQQWDLVNTGDWTIHVALFDHQSGWKQPFVMDTLDSYTSLSAAIDDQGRVIFVWSNSQVLSSWYVPNQGWQPVQTLNAGIPTGAVNVAIDSLGNAMAIWSAESHVYANYYKESQGWTGAVVLREPTPGYPSIEGLQVKMDAQGNAIALWEADYLIEIKRFNRLSGWQEMEYLGGLKSFGVVGFNFAMNAKGEAVIVWIEGYDLWNKQFTIVENVEDIYVVEFSIF